jgi:hypothetical protein
MPEARAGTRALSDWKRAGLLTHFLSWSSLPPPLQMHSALLFSVGYARRQLEAIEDAPCNPDHNEHTYRAQLAAEREAAAAAAATAAAAPTECAPPTGGPACESRR